MKNGTYVERFERAFAEYVGAKYAIALCNGTATLHTALVALGVKPGERVAVPPLTMSATTIAVLHAGAVPVFCDVGPDTWTMASFPSDVRAALGVSLFGLSWPGTSLDWRDGKRGRGERGLIDDAAQTLAPYAYPGDSYPDFKSYSFQASKILPLGEGGMLVTNDEELATRAREFSSLGYRMNATQPRIDPAVLKSPGYARHHTLGWNYRMSDLVAERGVQALMVADKLKEMRRAAAEMYADAISGCDWLTPQHVPEGWTHDYWCYAVAINFDTPKLCLTVNAWKTVASAIERSGGERPYAAWRLTYREPVFRHLAPGGTCPVAEDLQPRLMLFQTNNLRSAENNAVALRKAIDELG